MQCDERRAIRSEQLSSVFTQLTARLQARRYLFIWASFFVLNINVIRSNGQTLEIPLSPECGSTRGCVISNPKGSALFECALRLIV